jgi:UDP-N-acetylglucosamine 2-epimerase (non-hydrolysing)
MKTLLLLAGTRPEIIKVAPILLKWKEQPPHSSLQVKLCLTGQHQTMANEALNIFGITADANLEIMKPNQTLNDIAQMTFERLPNVLEKIKPNVVMVQGDTTTAAMSALCAFQQKIPVAHVEAGLRTFNLDAPFPEEANRKVIGSIASFHFPPTQSAYLNLLSEGIAERNIFQTGNTSIDALEYIKRFYSLDNISAIDSNIRSPFVLVTAHRRESFGEGFKNICTAIQTCAERFPDFQFIYPVHLNPNVRTPVLSLLGNMTNVLLIEPVSYLRLLTLLKHCSFVLTDSGGIQEESPSFGKYCIVMREVTERIESLRSGIAELVGTNSEKIITAVTREIMSPTKFAVDVNPYGDGTASEKILAIFQNHLH